MRPEEIVWRLGRYPHLNTTRDLVKQARVDGYTLLGDNFYLAGLTVIFSLGQIEKTV